MRVSHIFLLVSLTCPAGFFACSSDASLGSDRAAINKSGTGDPAGDEAKDKPTTSGGGSTSTPTPKPGDKDPPKDADGGASPLPDPTTDRPSYTNAECTAKGGVVFALAREFGLPIRFVGLGEKAADLREFDPAAFVDALLPESLGA